MHKLSIPIPDLPECTQSDVRKSPSKTKEKWTIRKQRIFVPSIIVTVGPCLHYYKRTKGKAFVQCPKPIYNRERSPNFSCFRRQSFLHHNTTKHEAYLVAWNSPAALGNELCGSLINIWSGSRNIILDFISPISLLQTPQHIRLSTDQTA